MITEVYKELIKDLVRNDEAEKFFISFKAELITEYPHDEDNWKIIAELYLEFAKETANYYREQMEAALEVHMPNVAISNYCYYHMNLFSETRYEKYLVELRDRALIMRRLETLDIRR